MRYIFTAEEPAEKVGWLLFDQVKIIRLADVGDAGRHHGIVVVYGQVVGQGLQIIGAAGQNVDPNVEALAPGVRIGEVAYLGKVDGILILSVLFQSVQLCKVGGVAGVQEMPGQTDTDAI